MCGIAGIINFHQKPIVAAKAKARAMMASLHHRGPDAEGMYLSEDETVLLINTRLSIVDVKNDFPLPIQSINSHSVLSYNGELYNYEQIRKSLTQQGVNFRSKVDSEVFLELINERGFKALKLLDGFWGFAHYSHQHQTVSLGRDLCGKKHVFYYQDSDCLIFASEIPPILKVLETPVSLDYASVLSSFKFRCAPPAKTLVSQIKKLLPGELISINLQNSTVKKQQLLKFDFSTELDFFAASPSELLVKSRLNDILDESFRNRLPYEVRYMASLSGGIDSSLMNIKLSALDKRTVNSLYGKSTRYKVMANSDELDELSASYYSSQKLKTQHHVFSMLDDENCVNDYKYVAEHSFDGVLCEGVVSFYQLAKQIRKLDAKVLMLSDGPDEYFTGYTRDIEAISSIEKGQSFRFETAHGGSKNQELEQIFHPDIMRQFFEYNYGIIPAAYHDQTCSLDVCQKMALSYVTLTMPDYYNLRTDRATMMASVELRLPLQTKKLIEFAVALPRQYRLDSENRGKKILRELVEARLGREISNRSKHGFAQPAWKDPKISKALAMQDELLSSGIFQQELFNKNIKNSLLRPENNRYVWMMYCILKTSASLDIYNQKNKLAAYA